jgi:hypothetical protein
MYLNRIVVILLVGVASLGLLAVYGLRITLYYESTTLPRSFALMEAADRGLFLGEEDREVAQSTNFQWGGYPDYCSLQDIEALRKLKTRHCYVVGFGRSADYCNGWWPWRCISVSITEETRNNAEIYARIEEIIAHPCRYLYDMQRPAGTVRNFTNLSKYWRVLGCDGESSSTTFDVALVIMGKPIKEPPFREVLDVVWLKAVTP